jgi:ketosteroid isomerase-like protein
VRIVLAVLAYGTVLAAKKLRSKGTDMEMAHNVSIPEWTEAISARLVAQWEAWKNQDAASNNAIIADDFNSFWPDGTRHIGKPTAQQMSEQPITGYKLSQLRVVPVGADAALVTYFADVKTPGDNLEHQMAVGEVWVKRNGQWLIRGYSGTLISRPPGLRQLLRCPAHTYLTIYLRMRPPQVSSLLKRWRADARLGQTLS